jgi:hypothetical protein
MTTNRRPYSIRVLSDTDRTSSDFYD